MRREIDQQLGLVLGRERSRIAPRRDEPVVERDIGAREMSDEGGVERGQPGAGPKRLEGQAVFQGEFVHRCLSTLIILFLLLRARQHGQRGKLASFGRWPRMARRNRRTSDRAQDISGERPAVDFARAASPRSTRKSASATARASAMRARETALPVQLAPWQGSDLCAFTETAGRSSPRERACSRVRSRPAPSPALLTHEQTGLEFSTARRTKRSPATRLVSAVVAADRRRHQRDVSAPSASPSADTLGAGMVAPAPSPGDQVQPRRCRRSRERSGRRARSYLRLDTERRRRAGDHYGTDGPADRLICRRNYCAARSGTGPVRRCRRIADRRGICLSAADLHPREAVERDELYMRCRRQCRRPSAWAPLRL